MCLQFEDICLSCSETHCEGILSPSKTRSEAGSSVRETWGADLAAFIKRFRLLSKDELELALNTTSRDLLSQLSGRVSCVGCRRSVEELLLQLADSRHPTMDPLLVDAKASISINAEHLLAPEAVFALFYKYG